MTTATQLFDLLIINLDRSHARWQHMAGHLDKLGFDYQRIAAIDGNDISDQIINRHYSAIENRKCYFAPLRMTEIACFLSHRKALSYFLEQGKQDCLILLEDDVAFLNCPALRQTLNALATRAANNEPTLVKLYAKRTVSGSLSQVDNSTVHLVKPALVPLGTQAQMWNRNSATIFLSKTSQFYQPVDVALQHWWKFGIDLQVVQPCLVRELSTEVGGSTISQAKQLPNIKKLKQEIIRPWFRLKLWLQSRLHYYYR